MRPDERHKSLCQIFGAPAAGFGDAVIYISVLKNAYMESGQRIALSRYTTSLKYDRRALYSQLLEVFELDMLVC